MLSSHPFARAGAISTRSTSPELPAGVPVLAAIGLSLTIGLIVWLTPIGSGDYGQWLMVSRAFSSESSPDYRALSDVPPAVPFAIAAAHRLTGEPVLALQLVASAIGAGLCAAFCVAGWALDRRALTGLAAAVLALLVTDRFVELFAFGGLPQAAAIAFLALALAAFGHALVSPIAQRRWWIAGCGAILAMSLSHIPTAMVGLPACLAAAGLSVLPDRRAEFRSRLRTAAPLVAGLAVVALHWLVVIAPASGAYVTNPASLAYRGPERVIDLFVAYPPTLAVVLFGAGYLGLWVGRHLVGGRLPERRDPRLIVLAWAATSWGAYLWSTVTGASTDFPRFAPLLLAPLVVATAVGLGATGAALARHVTIPRPDERGIMALGLAVVLVAPFSIARYQTDAAGYRLPDREALIAAATWTNRRLVPGAAILAPVREAKWIEGVTGRSALFSSEVRYAFRPTEWERSLAAEAVLRGNLALANGAFVLTLTDGVATEGGQQPRSLLIAANHGGEFVNLLRAVPESSLILDPAGETVASLPALEPEGMRTTESRSSLHATTAWTGERRGAAVRYEQALGLARGAGSFTLSAEAFTDLPVSGLQVELRPQTGVALVDVGSPAGDRQAGVSAELTFARIGRAEPRLRLDLDGPGTIAPSPAGGVLVTAGGPYLRVTVVDLTAGGASTSLRLLEPVEIVREYDVGAVVLRRDPAYDARRARLEGLGFHVALAEGPYVVMFRAGAAVPARDP